MPIFDGWMPGMKITTDAPTKPRAEPTPEVSAQSVSREDRPKFRREYTAALPGWRSIRVTASCRYFGSGRSFSGELTQPGGRWVLFDPERIADKILDPELVPVIHRICREIFRMDDEYMANGGPRRFKDDAGVTWERA